MVQGASATILINAGTPSVSITSGTYTWTEMYEYVNASQGQPTTNDTFFSEVESGVWLVKCLVKPTAPGVLMMDDNITEYRSTYLHTGGSWSIGGTGSWISDGVKYSTWDETTNAINVTGSRRAIFGANSHFNNTIIDGFTSWGLGNSAITDGNNSIVEYTYCTNYTIGLFYHGDNISFDYITMENPSFIAGTSGIKSDATESLSDEISNCTITNSIIKHIGDFSLGDSTGTYGIQTEGQNNYVNNVTVDGIRYVAFNLKGNNSIFSNLTASNATHNIIEAQASNSIFRDLYIDYSVNGGTSTTTTDTALFTALEEDEGYGNVTFENIYISDNFNGSGGAIKIASDGVRDNAIDSYIYKNVTSHRGHLYIIGLTNSKFINVSMNFDDTGFFQMEDVALNDSVNSYNVLFINSIFSNSSGGDILIESNNISFVNTITPTFSSFINADYTLSYPLNLIVQDGSNNPIENANITVTTDSFTLDGLGHEQYVFTTGADGKPTEQINIPNSTRDSSTGYVYHFSNVTVEKDGVSDSNYNIVPDTTWYSPDTSDLQGTLQTFTLDIADSIETPTNTVFVIISFVGVASMFVAARGSRIVSWVNRRITR
jgi:hypothetical protein